MNYPTVGPTVKLLNAICDDLVNTCGLKVTMKILYEVKNRIKEGGHEQETETRTKGK